MCAWTFLQLDQRHTVARGAERSVMFGAVLDMQSDDMFVVRERSGEIGHVELNPTEVRRLREAVCRWSAAIVLACATSRRERVCVLDWR